MRLASRVPRVGGRTPSSIGRPTPAPVPTPTPTPLQAAATLAGGDAGWRRRWRTDEVEREVRDWLIFGHATKALAVSCTPRTETALGCTSVTLLFSHPNLLAREVKDADFCEQLEINPK